MLKALLLAAALTAISASLSKADNTEGWQHSPEGDTILHPFPHAPFPHPSRSGGHLYDGKQYSYADHYASSDVAIFIPSGYRKQDSVHYVVHFHGWNNTITGAMKTYEMREQFLAANKNAILILPEGPVNAPDSGGGKLENDPGAFKKLMVEVTDFLAAEGKISTHKIGTILLSTHSGGYATVGGILKQGGLTEHITDVLLFDSTYGYLDAIADWAAKKHGRRLFSIFTEHLAPENFMLIERLQKRGCSCLARMEPEMTDAELEARSAQIYHTQNIVHDEIMQKTHLFERLLKTSGLPARKLEAPIEH
jgi:hypothetical protein